MRRLVALCQPLTNYQLQQDSPLPITLANSGQYEYSPLHHAVVNSDFDSLARIKDRVNSRDEFGNTPLHLVMKASAFDRNMAEALLALCADVNSQDFLGRTPLHSALARGCLDSVQLLLENGANPNIKDVLFDETPLNYLVSKYPASSSDYAALKLLCSFAADVEIPNFTGCTPVMNATKNPEGTVFFKLLVDHGACLDKTDRTGKTLLDMAAIWADAELIRQIGASGAWSYDGLRRACPSNCSAG